MNRLAALLLLFTVSSFATGQALAPPVAATKPHTYDFHGTKIEDPYFWLKDKKNPEVIQYLDAENAYREQQTKHLKPLEEKLYKEMLSHIKETDLDVPTLDTGYWYYSRTEAGKQYPIHCRKKGTLEAPEEVILDVNELAKGQKFMSAQPVGASDDTKLLAYLTDTTGFREYYLSVKDLATGKLLEDKFVKVAGFCWAGDNKSLFYITEDDAKRPHKLFRHTLGQPKEKDVLVYEEKDELYRLGVHRTKDKKFILHTSESSNTSEVRYFDTSKADGTWKVFAPRKLEMEYSVEHREGLFHIRTNKDGAVNFKWMTCTPGDTASSAWKDFERPNAEVFIEGIAVFKNHAVITERQAGIPQLRVHYFKQNVSRRLEFPEPSYDVNLGANPEYDTSAIRYNYTSLVTPNSVFEFDTNKTTAHTKLLKQTEVPGGFDKTNYTSERVVAIAPDGVKVPMSIVYRKGLKKDGTAPMFLYSYGSYGYSTDPSFNASRLVLLDRGVVFALAHIRGGSDMGRQWYLDGKLMNKKNTFTDFIACADHLVNQKYGSRDRLAIEGGSAGGLLIGAVLNRRPDLCKVAHLAVPFVDVINTMLDETLPLTVQEFLEWGNPKESVAGRYMQEYSPYDNLAKKAYPSIIVTTSLNDSQVFFHEPTKYVAKLRSLKTDKNPLILKCNMDAGHGGASGRYDSLKEKAYEYAFMLEQIGVKE